MKKIVLNILTLLPSSFLCAQSLIGSWNGSINIGQKSLPLVIHISNVNGENKCLLDSPDQGAKGIPTVLDYLSNDSIALRVPAIGVSYNGKMGDGLIKGTFCQSGMRLPLNLKPGNFVRERKQTPSTPLPYPTEEVTFKNTEDNAVLSGTISYPMTYTYDAEKVPVVLFVTGSGQQNRDEELMGHKPFAVLADYLAKKGIASLRYDDRGFGKSTGDLTHATSHTFMTDALAGIDYLKSTGKFSKIGIIGHSEGGLIAFMAASEKPEDVDFIVSLAGTAVRGDKILLKQNEILLSANPSTALQATDYCKVLQKIFQHLIDKKSIENAKDIVNGYATEVNAKLPVPVLQNLQTVLKTSNPWLNYFLSYDPTSAIQKTACPVMAINGEKDKQVDAAINMTALKKLLPKNENHLLKTYTGLNHLFQHCSSGDVNEYAQIEETISPEVMEDIARWINNLKQK